MIRFMGNPLESAGLRGVDTIHRASAGEDDGIVARGRRHTIRLPDLKKERS
jgi:hypothetical protein